MADYSCEWCNKTKVCDLKYDSIECPYENTLVGIKFEKQITSIYSKISECMSLTDEIVKETESEDEDGSLESIMDEVKRLLNHIQLAYLDDCVDENMIKKCKELFKEELAKSKND